MKSAVYYFSGTGNTLYASRLIAARLNAELIPIPSLINEETININADIIGITFPVYYGDMPVIVKNFTQKLINLSGKYIFAVSNYGGGAGESLKHLKNIIISRGGKLNAQFGLHMPQCAFKKPFENKNKLIKKAVKKIDLICSRIIQKKEGFLISDIIPYILLYPLHLLVPGLTKSGLAKLTSNSKDLKLDELINLVDKTFKVNEKCSACGSCAKICPVKNISIAGKKPVWLNKCENCLACYNFCPEKAISGAITHKDYFYHHPEIKLNDMIL